MMPSRKRPRTDGQVVDGEQVERRLGDQGAAEQLPGAVRRHPRQAGAGGTVHPGEPGNPGGRVGVGQRAGDVRSLIPSDRRSAILCDDDRSGWAPG